jgi:hypothetical protein
MSARLDACALKRLLRFGSAGAMTLLAVAACAIGSAGQRPAAAATAPPPAATAAAAPTAPVAPAAPAAQEQSPAPGAPSSANGAGSDKLLPPCVPVRRTRLKQHKPKPPPQIPAPAELPPQARADAVVDAQVGEEGTPLSSILGKDVKSPKGEDLGRVVDVLADARGHVRVAIIDFGGFLGVGTRRIAVDWPLLRFDPDSHDKPLILSVDRQKLQSAPEYNSNRPRVLMPPAAPDAPDTGQTTK